jgi:hypothetical protein
MGPDRARSRSVTCLVRVEREIGHDVSGHFGSQHHPIIDWYEPGGYRWYCYVDNLAFTDGAPSLANR